MVGECQNGVKVVDIDVSGREANGQLLETLGCSFQVILPALCTFMVSLPFLARNLGEYVPFSLSICPSLPCRPLYYGPDMLYITSLASAILISNPHQHELSTSLSWDERCSICAAWCHFVMSASVRKEDSIEHLLEDTSNIIDTSSDTILDTLNRQRRNQRSANTTSILSGQDLNGIFLALLPAEDLTQSLGATSLKVRVLVEDGSVGTDVGFSVVLLLTDGCDTAGRQTSSTGSDELGKTAEDLALGLSDGDVQLTTE